MSGLDFWRRITRPSTATTNSERKFSAFACASEFSSLLKTICAIPRGRQINKNQLAQIAPPMHPAHEDDVFIGVRHAEIRSILSVSNFPACQAPVPLRSDSRYSSRSFSLSFFCSPSARFFSVYVPELTSSSPMMTA